MKLWRLSLPRGSAFTTPPLCPLSCSYKSDTVINSRCSEERELLTYRPVNHPNSTMCRSLRTRHSASRSYITTADVREVSGMCFDPAVLRWSEPIVLLPLQCVQLSHVCSPHDYRERWCRRVCTNLVVLAAVHFSACNKQWFQPSVLSY